MYIHSNQPTKVHYIYIYMVGHVEEDVFIRSPQNERLLLKWDPVGRFTIKLRGMVVAKNDQ